MECAIDKCTGYNRALANRESPEYAQAAARNEAYAVQWQAKQGPWYDKWLAGVMKAAERGSLPVQEDSDTLIPIQSPAEGAKRKAAPKHGRNQR